MSRRRVSFTLQADLVYMNSDMAGRSLQGTIKPFRPKEIRNPEKLGEYTADFFRAC